MNRTLDRLTGPASTPELVAWHLAWSHLRARLAAVREEEHGMTTETVIITAGLAALAVTVVAIIAARVRARANLIP